MPSAGKYWSTVLPTGGFCRWGDIPASFVSVIAYFWHELQQLEYSLVLPAYRCESNEIVITNILQIRWYVLIYFFVFQVFLLFLSTLDGLFSVILSVLTGQRRTLETEDINAENVDRDF